jgi:hypothetical protein
VPLSGRLERASRLSPIRVHEFSPPATLLSFNAEQRTVRGDPVRSSAKNDTRRQHETWRADTYVVIPAKAGIQPLQRLMDSGSPLRCGRNDGFCSQGAFFRRLVGRYTAAVNVQKMTR